MAEEVRPPVTLGFLVRNFLWDILLMLILIINLIIICFDWFFSIPDVYGFFMESAPGFFEFYNPIHIDMKMYDLFFVGIYLIDVVVGWSVSFFRNKEKVYDYPISHWYDLLGCVPAGTLVFLRLLRIISIVMRLYKKNLINLHKVAFFRKCMRIYNIILEEVSDRVVLNILDGIKSNVRLGMPITREVIDKIVIPHKKQIIDIVFSKFRSIASREYADRKNDLAQYIAAKSRNAVEGNKELARLKMIPVLGSQITDTIERSVSQTVVSVVDSLVTDAISDSGQAMMRDITNEVSDIAIQDLEQDLSKIVTDVVVEVVDLIGRTANVKQWKLNEKREQINAAKSVANPDNDLIDRLEQEYNEMLIHEIQKGW